MRAITNRISACLGTLGLVLLAAPAMAEENAERPKLDTDGDGYVSQEEFAASRIGGRVEFSDIDKDADGRLSRDELIEYRRENGRQRAGRRTEG